MKGFSEIRGIDDDNGEVWKKRERWKFYIIKRGEEDK